MKDYLFLPDRLKAVAKHIPQCRMLSDIGTDHAYIPIYAIKNNIAKTAAACDIVDGPLKIAAQNIASYSLTDKISVIKSDGLKNAPESDVFVIAGMGGTLIGEIIENDIAKAKKADCLVLQPMTCAYELRKKLHETGFEIIDESIAKDTGKLYNIIVAKKGNQLFDDEILYYTGKATVDNNDPLLEEFLIHKTDILKKRVVNMQNSENPEVKSEAEAHKKLIDAYIKVGEKIGYSW